MEDNVSDIAHRLFNGPIKPPNSIRLELDDIDTTDQNQIDTILFKMMMNIFTEGMKIKHGDCDGQVDLAQVSLGQMHIIRQYMQSIGFDILLTVNDTPHFEEMANPQSFETLCVKLRFVKEHDDGTYQDFIYGVSFRSLDWVERQS